MSGEKEKDSEEKFRAVIETIDVASALTEPFTGSIKDLLQISAAEMNSEEASVLIRDGDDGDLQFFSVIGKVAEQLKGLKIPAGKGIAGFVFSSGQPMSVSDAGKENSFYSEVDKHTGYSTQAILATPLRHNGEIIGVLEYINRTGEPPFEAFSPAEMDKAGIFADAIAALVSAYESAKLFRDLGGKIFSGDEQANFTSLREWLKELRATEENREMLELAIVVREIAGRGEAERRMCREILEAVLRFSEGGRETSFLNF